MLSLYFWLDIIVAAAYDMVGLLALVRDSKSTLNRLFAAFTFSVAGWILANYFSNNFQISHETAVVANRLALLLPGTALVFLLNFTLIMVGRNPRALRWVALSLMSEVIFLCSLTPLVMSSISRQGDVYAITFGPLGGLYFATILTLMLLPVVLLATRMRVSNGEERDRLSTILWGLILLLVVNVTTNALLPALTNSFALTNIGPISSFFLVYALWYSIVKHKLFDIRSVVARSMVYILSLGSLIAIFAGGTFLTTSILFPGTDFTNQELQNFYAALAVMLALVFGPLKRFFDKTTNKFFYRDAYDSQELFSELNKVLVSSLDVKYLMQQSISVIETALKPEFLMVDLRDSDKQQRIYASKKLAISKEDAADLQRLLAKMYHKVVVTDYTDAVKHRELHKLLQRNNIAAVARLTQNARSGEEGFGYLLLGVKKSGNPYTPQDSRVLDTVANELIIAIQNALHYEEIQKFNVELQARINEATHKLRSTNEKLKALDETKDDFISMASHQLRTPLTSVKGYLSMVLEGDAGDINETQRKMLGQAYISSQRMVYLIADLLNVSRLKTGKFILESKPTDLSAMIDEELGQLTEAATSRSLTLSYEKPKDFPMLMLDETKTRQVLMNFIDNAIYYTPKDGHIKIELKDTGPTVEFRVIDDGIGVPKSEQHHLFTKFYRAGNARQARPDGTGLGLFMAKKVITAQNGALIFDSKEGVGSTFGFTFAKDKLALPAAEATHDTAAAPQADVKSRT